MRPATWLSSALRSCVALALGLLMACSGGGGGTQPIPTPAPVISGFAPLQAVPGAPVTITGSNLENATVKFNGITATVSSNTSTQVVAAVPGGATSGFISVTTAGGTATSIATFTVLPPSPGITGFSPTSGLVGAAVSITGTHLTGATAVSFNGTNAPSFTVGSSTQITATVPLGATSGPIAVTTPGGTATSSTSFIVAVPAPTITGFNPTSGVVGTSVAVSGTNFSGASAVTFNGIAASFTIEDSTQLTATVPATASGPITVTTPGGTATSASSFTVTVPAPAITGFSPASGSVGSIVVITGTNFSGASAVAFNSVSAPFTINSPSQITATVPATTSGPIAVTTSGGTAVSSSSFIVTPPAPTIAGFSPGSGSIGSSVVITGTNFTSASAVKFNGVGAPFTINHPAQITATVPATTSGPITVTTPGGTATSASAFIVTAPAPTISGFNPTSGHVGASVVITGTNFSLVFDVAFNGAGAVFTLNSPTQITATVPATTSGPISVASPGGTATSAANFTVTPSGPTADLFIDGAYVTQSAQNYAGAVPLVGGKASVLRIFVLGNQAGITAPSVRVRTYSGATLTDTQTIAPTLSTAPTAVSEGSLNQSWNYPLSGAATQPGLGLLIDVDPANAIAEADETNNFWPSTGTPMALDVRALETFHGTLIPITQSGLTGNATSGNLASWYAKFQKMFPIAAGMDVLLGATYTTSQVLASDGSGWSALLGELEAKRLVEASTRYYFGALNVSYGSGVAGLGYVPASGSSTHRSALGWDKTSGYADGGLYFDVLTHETGHNLGRFHSPCGGAADADPGYPYAGGLIGIYGLDVAAMSIKDPAVYTDIMGYCSPVWISDYVYHSILDFRQASPFGSAPASAQDCLLVSGRIHNSHAELDPALRVRLEPTPQRGEAPHGSRLIEGRDASGTLLFQRWLPLSRVADDIPGSVDRHFLAAIPTKEIPMAALAELRLLGDSGVDAVRWSSQALPLKSGAVQMPQAWASGEGEVRLVWDANAHPLVMVRDAGTGDVLSFARGGGVAIKTSAKRLELTPSNGVSSESALLEIR
ncbi:MAG: IPT/TIG domain-containing protein [Holophagaceae bacterium]|nr:IPT/TIG domain-containing protein [Holophagaceae bacterium]